MHHSIPDSERFQSQNQSFKTQEDREKLVLRLLQERKQASTQSRPISERQDFLLNHQMISPQTYAQPHTATARQECFQVADPESIYNQEQLLRVGSTNERYQHAVEFAKQQISQELWRKQQ